MDCKNITLLLPEYSQNRLGDEERKTVEKHLETCKTCRAELDEISGLLKATSTGEPGLQPDSVMHFESLWPGIYERAQKEGLTGNVGGKRSLFGFLKEQFTRRPYQFAGVPVMIALTVILVLNFRGERYEPNKYSVAYRMSRQLSDMLSESVKEGYDTAQPVEQESVSAVSDTAFSSPIDLSGLLTGERRVSAYENFTDMLADFLVKTQNN